VLPLSAKQAPVTSPTYPVPMMVSFKLRLSEEVAFVAARAGGEDQPFACLTDPVKRLVPIDKPGNT
jgi:hypothetical protein